MGDRITVAIVTEDASLKRTLLGLAAANQAGFDASHFVAVQAALADGHLNRSEFILIDLDLPRGAALECIQRIRARAVRSKVVVLARPQELELVFRALEAGADGCFPRGESLQTLRTYLGDFRDGGAPISIQVAKWIVSYYQNKGKSNDPIASLSGRENEILELLAKGFSDKQMARHLMIAQSTVNDHLKSIYRRLGVHSRAEAVAKYLSRNFRAG